MRQVLAIFLGWFPAALFCGVATAQPPRPSLGPEERGPGRRPGGAGEAPAMSPDQLLRQFDRDRDRRISLEEAPERMRQRWAQLDSNQDGFITRDELAARDARVGRAGPVERAQRPERGAGPSSRPDSDNPLPQSAGGRRREGAFQPSGLFSVIPVGTGTPRYDPQRSGPSAMIQYRGRYFLVDMGNGTQAQLNQAGIGPRQIDALVLTHHHLDHNEEFIPLFIQTRLAGGQPAIVGPPQTAKLVDFILQFYAEDIAYRLRRSGRTMEDFGRASVREVKGGERFDLGGMKVQTAAVPHTIQTVAYRFEAEGQAIVISGDLTYSESLIELARNADVLVMDSGGAIRRVGGGRADGAARGDGARPEGAAKDGLKAHSTFEEVAMMAQKARVRRLVLTHIGPGEVDEEATRRGLAETYPGEVLVAHDMLEVSAAPAASGVSEASSRRRAAANARVYVRGDAAGPRDGKSWATAFASIQEGIDAAADQGGGEVWVTQGTFKPTDGTDRDASIQLRSGVAVYGGFAGTETSRDARDWAKHPTILSGDIGRAGVNTDNSRHVVIGADHAVLDGFVIADGYAMDGGMGMGGGARGPRRGGAEQGPPGGPRQGPAGGPPIHTTPDAILSGPNPGAGAGMVNFQAAPTICNCTFQDNSAGKGGAMYNMSSRSFPPRREATPAPMVVNCRFLRNHARGRGGAVANDLGTSPTFRQCTFVGNSCDAKGGAIYDDFGCSPLLANCLFAQNRAASAGAVGNDGGSSPRIVHCTFTANVADEEGAALYQGSGPANNPVVIGCILWGNRCENGPAEIFNWHDNNPQVTGSCVQGGYPGEGNFDEPPAFVDAAQGDFRPGETSPCKAIGYTATTSEELLKDLARSAPMFRPKPESAPPPRQPVSDAPRVTLYVRADNAAGPWDGTSWKTAFRSLQPALAAAADRPADVWVAAGTYKPTEGADRGAAFVLPAGVAVYGGFRGLETQLAQRDAKANPAILSGDIGQPGVASDNAYHVLIGGDGAVLDGLVIRDGYADGWLYDGKGGGMINYRRGEQAGPMGPPTGLSPIVRNCLFTANRAREGGAVYNYDRGQPQFLQCRFVDNRAEYGGAMVDRVGVKSELSGCEFERNTARWRAGAIYLDYGARPRLSECRFVANQAGQGGAMAMLSRASQLEATIPLLKNCTFADNVATRRGGAIANADNCRLGLEACTFTGNRAGTGGGALANDSRAAAVLVDCRFSGNASDAGQADIAADDNSPVSRDRADWPSQETPSKPSGPPPGRPGR